MLTVSGKWNETWYIFKISQMNFLTRSPILFAHTNRKWSNPLKRYFTKATKAPNKHVKEGQGPSKFCMSLWSMNLSFKADLVVRMCMSYPQKQLHNQFSRALFIKGHMHGRILLESKLLPWRCQFKIPGGLKYQTISTLSKCLSELTLHLLFALPPIHYKAIPHLGVLQI